MEVLQSIDTTKVPDDLEMSSTAIVPFTSTVSADSWDKLAEFDSPDQPPLKYRKVAWFDKGS